MASFLWGSFLLLYLEGKKEKKKAPLLLLGEAVRKCLSSRPPVPKCFPSPLGTLSYSSSGSPLLVCSGHQQSASGCWALGKNNFRFYLPPLVIIRVTHISPQKLNFLAISICLVRPILFLTAADSPRPKEIEKMGLTGKGGGS